MKAGISTACLYPMVTEEALGRLLARGMDNIEIFINTGSELEQDFQRELRAMVKDAGAHITAIHPFTSGFEGMMFFGNYQRRMDDSLEFYKKYFEAAAQLGASYLVFHGPRAGNNLDYGFYAQRYHQLDRAAQAMGVRLAQENVSRCTSKDPGLFTYLRKELDDPVFVLDVKQARRAQVDPLEMMEAMGKGLRHLHISDCTPENCCLAVGQGAMDTEELMGRLRGMDYQGALILELYRDSYGEEKELEESVGLLRQLCEE